MDLPKGNISEWSFFVTHKSNDPLISSIALKIKDQNEKENFVPQLIQRAGIPFGIRQIFLVQQIIGCRPGLRLL